MHGVCQRLLYNLFKIHQIMLSNGRDMDHSDVNMNYGCTHSKWYQHFRYNASGYICYHEFTLVLSVHSLQCFVPSDTRKQHKTSSVRSWQFVYIPIRFRELRTHKKLSLCTERLHYGVEGSKWKAPRIQSCGTRSDDLSSRYRCVRPLRYNRRYLADLTMVSWIALEIAMMTNKPAPLLRI